MTKRLSSFRIVGATDPKGAPVALSVDVGRMASDTDGTATFDASGLVIAPGFIDLQLNGGWGDDFTTDPASIWRVGSRLPATGVTAFCPTIITSRKGRIEAAQAAMASRPLGYHGAEPLGLHVEGPHLSVGKRGTHPEHLLRPPSDWDASTDHVAIVTVAPELPGALELITRLVGAGVSVSIGHSEATATEALAAIDAGATLGTHLFNAMPPVAARDPGLTGVLLTDGRVRSGVIADGHHLDPTTLRLAWAAARDRLFLITDGVAAMGLDDGAYTIGEIDVEVRGGVVRNRDGALAGASVTLDRQLANLMRTTRADLADAIRTVTTNPASAVGAAHLVSLEPGTPADATFLDGENVVATVVRGSIEYLADPGRWEGADLAAP